MNVREKRSPSSAAPPFFAGFDFYRSAAGGVSYWVEKNQYFAGPSIFSLANLTTNLCTYLSTNTLH